LKAEEINDLIKYVQSNNSTLEFNLKLFEIREGNLVKYLEEALIKQIDAKSVNVALNRKSPINILPKIVDKLSKVYTGGCVRKSSDEQYQALVGYYEKALNINTKLTEAVKNFNTYKNFWLEIYIDGAEVKVRPIPSYEIIAYSETRDDKISHVIRCMGDHTDQGGKTTKKYWIYSETEFISVTADGKMVEQDMIENGGTNPFGIIPFVYISNSTYLLTPIPDYDLFCMTLLVPILFTDLNFASMFSHHGIIYTIDVNAENLKISPDTFWNLKTEIDGKTPSVGILRPETNADNDLNLLRQQLATWLYTKNIKPSGLSNLTSENFVSGFALLISNLDTVDYTIELQNMMKNVEEKELWKKLATIHNYAWNAGMLFNGMIPFSEDVEVTVEFPEIKVIEDRTTTIANVKAELEAGLTSKKRALKRLNPKMTDLEVDDLLQEINEEKEYASKETMEVRPGSSNEPGQPDTPSDSK